MTDVKVSELSFIAQELTAPETIVLCLVDINKEISDIDEKIAYLKAQKDFLTPIQEKYKEQLREYVGQTIAGFKIWTKSADSVQMDKDAVIPHEFQRIKIEPDKIAIKKAIQAGQEINGFWIETKQHIQVTANLV